MRSAERAEVGRTSFFRIYGAKAGLLLEFNQRLEVGAREAIAAQPSAGAIARLQIVRQTLAAAWTATGPGLSEMLRAFLSEAGPALFSAALDVPAHPGLLSLVAEIVEEGQRTGEFESRLQPDFLSWLIVTGLATATGQWVTGRNAASLEEITDDVLEVLLRGMIRA
ncbi:TetR/AcrR family transcriptional regulator C-terminal domain-containing protein [Streptomyces sp. GTA36]